METILYELSTKDGRTFRVFCANRTQKQKVINTYYANKHIFVDIKSIANGIHTTKQFLEIVKKLN